MSDEKKALKELKDEQLEKVAGGFHEDSDPMVGKGVTLQYKKDGKIHNSWFQVLKSGRTDLWNPGLHFLYIYNNEVNQSLQGWISTDQIYPNYVFSSKEELKSALLTDEEMIYYDDVWY